MTDVLQIRLKYTAQRYGWRCETGKYDGHQKKLKTDVSANLLYLMWFSIYVIQGVPFIVTPSTADLSHTKPASAETYCYMPAVLGKHTVVEDVYIEP